VGGVQPEEHCGYDSLRVSTYSVRMLSVQDKNDWRLRIKGQPANPYDR